MRPQRADIAAPELPPGLAWLNLDRAPRIAELLAGGPVLMHFFDFAQLNSIRSLPYVLAWRDRYDDAGLTVIGAHSPRFGFTGDRSKLAAALERLRIEHPVADDSGYQLWHDYGCRGWPSLFVWGAGGALRWVHFGEGEYEATEIAITEELRHWRPDLDPPPPLDPLRAEDAPGALVAPPSDEVFPGGGPSQPWRPADETAPLSLEYAAGGAFASVDGEGELRVVIDDQAERRVAIEAAGLVELASHPRHSEHRLRLACDRTVSLYSVSFAPGLP